MAAVSALPFCFRETSETEPLRGLRGSDPRPVDTAGRPGPGVARRLPEVPGVPPVPGRVLHVFRQGRQDLLQEGLCKVMRRRGIRFPQEVVTPTTFYML